MIPNKLLEAVAVIAIATAVSGNLPRVLKAVHVAQLKLLKDSQASRWPKAILLPDRR